MASVRLLPTENKIPTQVLLQTLPNTNPTAKSPSE